MDRFAWSDGSIPPSENTIIKQDGVRLYDGEDKVCNLNLTIDY